MDPLLLKRFTMLAYSIGKNYPHGDILLQEDLEMWKKVQRRKRKPTSGDQLFLFAQQWGTCVLQTQTGRRDTIYLIFWSFTRSLCCFLFLVGKGSNVFGGLLGTGFCPVVHGQPFLGSWQ